MVLYHTKTLELLELTEKLPQPNFHLEKYALTNDISIPSSFREWSELDTDDILEKYSNCDSFWLTTPEIVILENGIRGLLFNRESQGNFDRIIPLGMGEDPPVMFAWIGVEPWVEFSSTFSDFVYSQIFDWQYLLEFDNEGHAEIAYYGEINLDNSDDCLTYLKNNFIETVQTNFIVEGEQFTEYRFYRSLNQRIIMTVGNDITSIRVTGEYHLVRALEQELLQQFADIIISET